MDKTRSKTKYSSQQYVQYTHAINLYKTMNELSTLVEEVEREIKLHDRKYIDQSARSPPQAIHLEKTSVIDCLGDLPRVGQWIRQGHHAAIRLASSSRRRNWIWS